jgi:P-type E1-E2 ATPase
MAFDKTGTLTRGVLRVDGVIAFGSHSQESVLALAASLEQNSNHILANAIVTAAQSQNLKLVKAKHVREIAGRGLEAQVRGQAILVGSLNLLADHEINIPAKYTRGSIKQTAAYVAIDGALAGIISLEDELRPESKATLVRLHTLGIKEFIMVTGDNEATAQAIAKSLGITHVHANALPADKLHILDEIKARPMVFVGDGVNDSPILTAADVGIALGARGSTAASESADVVIMPDDLSRVAMATAIAKRTFHIARQSILVGIGLSLLLMVVFASGKFSPLAGAIIQEVVDVIVIMNALRAHTGSIISG